MSSDLAIPEEFRDIGLEDYDPKTDSVMPTIRIDHQKGVFVDALSKVEYPELEVVALGLIKQRVLWDAEIEEGESKGPLCRSYNFTEGVPDQNRFPWGAALNEKLFWPENFAVGTEALNCESCPLQQWGSHPTRDAPWCSEQHTFAVMMPVGSEGEGFAPALLTVQRSAIKPSKTYITNFHRARVPMFTCFTKITLDERKRGNVTYSVPKFTQGGPTDRDLWPVFADNYRSVREFIQTPRVFDEPEEPAGVASGDARTDERAAATDDELPF